MHSAHRICALVLGFALVACGGSTPPPNDASSNDGTSNGASDADDGKSANGEESNSVALASERKEFMRGCASEPDLEDFCACSWDHVKKTTTAEDRKDVENPNTKKALSELSEVCAAKMPKGMLKEAFVKSCTKSPAMASFCECSYHFLDARGLVTSGAEGVARVENEMKAACSNELFELSRAAFLKGCGRNQPEAVCKCTFGSLEKKYGKVKLQAFLESGSEDVKKEVRAAGTTCGAK